jgi:hypothetical protein
MDLTSLNNFISSNKDKAQYFLLLLTPGSDGNSINVQAANQTSETLPTLESFTKTTPEPLERAISTYITSSNLNTLYKDTTAVIPAPVLTSQEIIDSILAHYSSSNDYNKAVSEINTNYGIVLQKVDGTGAYADAENTDVTDESTLNNLLQANIGLFTGQMKPMSGGSRSMKNRRRHRKKNKNTKRRTRK